MTPNRPKRKTALNKTYNDSIDETLFEDHTPSSSLSSSSSKKKQVKGAPTKSQERKIIGRTVPYNWQPPPVPLDYFSHTLDLTDAYIGLSEQTLYCPHQPLLPTSYEEKKRRKKDIFKLKKGDYIYMISEPPGEPYYIGRIMGFKKKLHSAYKREQFVDGVHAQENSDINQVYANDYLFEVQWFYRPRDISKLTSDSRLLYASMHTDTCPLQSFRGLVTVKHKSEIESENANREKNHDGKKALSPFGSAVDKYVQCPNCFYFDKLFDRYMIKFYDVIPTSIFLPFISENNSNNNFLKAIHKRFEYVFVETHRSKAFIEGFSSGSCNCENCGQWCSGQDSVTCVSCKQHFHMYCLDPPLLRKPSRGFSWTCAPCAKKHDIEHQSKKLVMLSNDNKGSNELELTNELKRLNTPESPSDELNHSDEPMQSFKSSTLILPKYEVMAAEFLKNDANNTLEQRRLKEEWCMRYLGMYAKLEDCIDVHDKSPYPKASTRLGTKHQATNIPDYEGHPIVYYDATNSLNASSCRKKSLSKKLLAKSDRKDPIQMMKLPIPPDFQNIPEEDFPQWLQKRPKGYIQRGVDDGEGTTCTLLWKASKEDERDNFKRLDAYVDSCAPVAQSLDLYPTSPNFMDAVVFAYMKYNGDVEAALKDVKKLTRDSLKEPTFTKEEIKRFEAGVKKYGSELHPVAKLVKTQPISLVVRFYYLWKKTKNGRLIWGNFEGRRKKKLQNIVKDDTSVKTDLNNLQVSIDSLADSDEDSAYDQEKILKQGSKFMCKHCHTRCSIRWYRITGFDANTKMQKELYEELDKECVIGLCFRCARLWRRYAVIWESPEEVERKNWKYAGGWKRKLEPELIRDSALILEHAEAQDSSILYEETKTSSLDLLSDDTKRTKRQSSTKATESSLVKKSTASSKASSESKNVKLKSNDAIPKKNGNALKVTSKTDAKVLAEPSQLAASSKKPSNKPTKKSAPDKNKKNDSRELKVKKKSSAQKLPNESTSKGTQPKVLKNKRKATEEMSPSTANKSSKLRDQKQSIKLKEDSSEITLGSSETTPAKRHRKNNVDPSLSNQIISPIFNQNYLLPKFSFLTKLDKKSVPIMTEDSISDIVQNFKRKQLADISNLLQGYQVPNNVIIDVPFRLNQRNCSVCRTADEKSANEMLICANCGVNVHSTCSGISVPSNIPPRLKQWLCDPCTNDLNPHHSILYTCSLCLANEPNYEFSMLGQLSVIPDFLKPINDTGRWCHLTCAVFNAHLIRFRLLPSVLSHKRISKDSVPDQHLIIEAMHNFLAIDSVSEVYIENDNCKCGICSSYNGSLVHCDLCDNKKGVKYHVTCAQDSPGFLLGFKLGPYKPSSKGPKQVTIGQRTGSLIPILLCPAHLTSPKNYFPLRAQGKLSSNNQKPESKPLIDIYLEGLAKYHNVSNGKLSGAQIRAQNYVAMIKTQQTKYQKPKPYIDLTNSIQGSHTGKMCLRCRATTSPMWWPSSPWSESENILANNPSYLCQICYHNERSELNNSEVEETEKLYDVLTRPLSGCNYGIRDKDDKLSDIYH